MIVYETEIWPNFYKICGYENIKLCIVNARIQKNLHKKKFVKKIYVEALENCQFILCKSNYEKKKYLELGINEKNIFSIGNLKYAYKLPVIKEEDQKKKSTEFSNTKNFFLMASTHDPDEKNFLQAIQELLINEISVVIAPRHIERSKKIANIFRDTGISVHFLSNASKNYVLGEWSVNAVLIIDTFGDLSKYYSNARYVYVGGGYSKRGVQNIIEPSIYGKPILVGPNIDNFYEEIMNLKAQNGITVIEDVASISTTESIAKHIRKFRNLNDEALIKRGDVAKEHSLKFKNIVEKYVEFLKQKKVIS
jgi:3-deoxy-D-manno-octulosonic-acid transferase